MGAKGSDSPKVKAWTWAVSHHWSCKNLPIILKGKLLNLLCLAVLLRVFLGSLSVLRSGGSVGHFAAAAGPATPRCSEPRACSPQGFGRAKPADSSDCRAQCCKGVKKHQIIFLGVGLIFFCLVLLLPFFVSQGCKKPWSLEAAETQTPSVQTQANVTTQNKGNCKAHGSRWGSQAVLLLRWKEIEVLSLQVR